MSEGKKVLKAQANKKGSNAGALGGYSEKGEGVRLSRNGETNARNAAKKHWQRFEVMDKPSNALKK